MKKNTIEIFIKKANGIFNNKYDYSLFKYENNKTNGIILCPNHGEFIKRPDAHIIQKQGCPRCSKINNYDDFIIKIKKIHNKGYYEYEKFTWKSSKSYIKVFCKNHNGYFKLKINDHLNGTGCSICNKNILTTELFYKNIYNIHTKYDYSKLNFRIGSDIGIIICPEHGEFKQKIIDHYNGSGCPKCSGKNKTNIDFIKESITIHNNKYNYSLSKYINSTTKVKIICPEHGEFKQTPNKHLNGRGCPKSKYSKGEKKIYSILVKKDIKFETQKKFIDCKYKRFLKFDFYIPHINTCIEFDGEQHTRSINYWGGEKNFNNIKIRDEIKNEYCEKNNIKLYRIKYNDNIDKILNFLFK